MGSVFGNPKKKQKSTSSSTQTTNYSNLPFVETQDSQYARQKVREGIDSTAPIHGAFNSAIGDIKNQYYEEDLPEGVEDEIRASKLFDLKMKKGQALAEATSRDAAHSSGQAMGLAGLTSGKYAPTSQSQSGDFFSEGWDTGIMSNPLFGPLIGGAIAGA